MQQMRNKAYWTVAGDGLFAHIIDDSSSRQCRMERFSQCMKRISSGTTRDEDRCDAYPRL